MERLAMLVCWVLPAVLAGCAAAPVEVSVGPEPLAVAARTVTEDGVTVATLSNGLTVIVAENHSLPVVCVKAYVRAGGLYEREYLGCGISHLCEHLVAGGAEHTHPGGGSGRRPGRRSSRVDRIGGQSNAYTTLDHTCYYIAATASKTGECIDLVADWLARAEITEKDFRREHGVVQRELEMGRDDPRRQMWHLHARNFFGTHPAAVPVIGLAEPLAHLRRRDVLAYHRRMYGPGNMAVAVVGDFHTEEVLRRLCRAFAGFAPGRVPDLSLPPVPPVVRTRRVVATHRNLTEAMECLSFQTIPLVHPDLYALDVLSYILTNGESSRLVRTVKRRRKLVTDVSSSSWTPAWGRGQFTINFRCRPELVEKAEAAIIAELRRVVREGVTAGELARAKRQKVADFVYSQQTVESQAETLVSDYISTGDVGFSRHYTQRIGRVTPAEVKAVAARYFNFDAMVITRMLPEGKAVATAPARRGGSAGRTKTFTLPNGLRVVLHSSPAVGLVSMALVTRGGLLLETERTNGMGAVMTALSTKGAGKLNAEQIAALFDQAGGRIAGACGNNTFSWRATVLADSFARVLPVFADVVVRPTFPAKELDTLRPSLIARIRRTQEHWYGQLNSRFRSDFFRDSPLSRLPVGREEVVASATAEDVAAYHRRYVRAGASVLTIYGRFDLDEIEAKVREYFAAMPPGQVPLPVVSARKVAPSGELYVHRAKLKGAGVIVAVPGMTLAELDDRLAMMVLDTIISGYRLPRGWLHSELRGRKLVYVVHAYNWPALVPGAFLACAQCEPRNAPLVAEIIRREFRRALSYPFSRAEVEEAVNMILTAELLENQSVGELAMRAALDELYGFGFDFRKRLEKRLRAVRPEDVARVARKYLSGGYVTTVVTPAPEVFGGVRK